MNAVNQPMKKSKQHKFATLTALATACTMMLSTPVIAATETADTNTVSTANLKINVPSAIDSSKRVIRRSQPNAAISTVQSSTQSDIAQAPTAQANEQSNPVQSPNAQANEQPNPAQSPNAQANEQPNPAQTTAKKSETSELTGTTSIYQRGPITATGIDISSGQLPSIPVPQVQISDISFVPTVLIAQTKGVGTGKLDVSLLDDFIKEASPHARHYPPNFPNRTQRYSTREKIKVLTEWIEPYASAPDASYDVLIRAAKLNGMGRNLDLGSDFAVRGGQYVDRAIKSKTDSGEANFLYGMMLAEGGGFKEGQKYLDRAVALGYTEAEQSLAQSDLLNDRRSQALDRLRRLEQQVPDNSVIRQQIKIVEDGKFYIWDLPASTIDIKPTT